MAKTAQFLSNYRPKVLLVGIHAPYNHTPDIHAYYEEFVNLVKSNNIQFDEMIFFKLRDIDAGTFIQKGKLDQLFELCEKHDIDEVILSEPISPQQERNLRDHLHRKVFDRTQLILEIFEKSAHSAEGKTQVQIAMLQHKKSRLSGRGVHLAQQSGAAGTMAGAGETAKERERRHIEDDILKLKKQLLRIHQTRDTQRKQRLTHDVPLMCLIGYTNAGKSTILNALTKSDVLAEDRLFATLDTTTRQLFINGKKKGVLSDTVGFIQLLPPKLVEAFKSTLMELQYGDLLLHVVDIADPNWENHIHVVEQILDDLDVEKPVLFVFNKVDKISVTPAFKALADKFQPNVFISSKTKEGLKPLVDYIENWKPKI